MNKLTFNTNNINTNNINNFNNTNNNKSSIKNAQTFFKKTLNKYITKEKKKSKKFSAIHYININNINKYNTQEILKDNIIHKISNSPKKRLLLPKRSSLERNSIKKKSSFKSMELFSASNKYITQIQTEKIKYDMLESLGDNLYKVIFFYIKENNYNKVNYLIKQNSEFINMNYRDNEGYTFLNTSLKYNCKKEIIEFLIKKGSNPNICDNKGNSPLHYALSHKNFPVVNLLIKFGANENFVNCLGLYPWQCIGINLETLTK
jgi:ankyrin repeat protein